MITNTQRLFSLVLGQPAVASRLRAFAVVGGVRSTHSRSADSGWQQVLSSLSPAHCALMSRPQKLAIMNLCRLDSTFQKSLPREAFITVVQSAAEEPGGLGQWPSEDLATLLIYSRAANLHDVADVAASVRDIESELFSRDLSSLPLDTLADVFRAFLGGIATASPAVAALAGELSRRATQLEAKPVSPEAGVRTATMSAAIASAGPPVATQATATALQSSAASAASVRQAETAVPANDSRAAAAAAKPVELNSGTIESRAATASAVVPPATQYVDGTPGLGSATALRLAELGTVNTRLTRLSSLSTIDEVVSAVEDAVAAVLQAQDALDGLQEVPVDSSSGVHGQGTAMAGQAADTAAGVSLNPFAPHPDFNSAVQTALRAARRPLSLREVLERLPEEVRPPRGVQTHAMRTVPGVLVQGDGLDDQRMYRWAGPSSTRQGSAQAESGANPFASHPGFNSAVLALLRSSQAPLRVIDIFNRLPAEVVPTKAKMGNALRAVPGIVIMRGAMSNGDRVTHYTVAGHTASTGAAATGAEGHGNVLEAFGTASKGLVTDARAAAAALVRRQETIDQLRAMAIMELLRRAGEKALLDSMQQASGSNSNSRSGAQGRMAATASGVSYHADGNDGSYGVHDSGSSPGDASNRGQQQGRMRMDARDGGATGTGDAGTGSSGSGTGNNSGSSGGGEKQRRNDWRKRAADGTIVAGMIAGGLTIGAIVTGLQAAQVPVPSQRLVQALERASPGTLLRIVRYVAGPFPSLGDAGLGFGLGGSAGAGAGAASQANAPAPATGSWGGAWNVTSLLKADRGHTANSSNSSAGNGSATAANSEESFARALFRAAVRQSPVGLAQPTASSGTATRPADSSNGSNGVQGGPVHRGGVNDTVAATVVSAARRALARTGLEHFSPAQLAALVELMANDCVSMPASAALGPGAGPSAAPSGVWNGPGGLLDSGSSGAGAPGFGSGAVPPSPFWDAVLRAALSRPVTAYTAEQRVALAHRFARVARLAGSKYSDRGREFARGGAALLSGLGDEAAVTHGAATGAATADSSSEANALAQALASSPTLIPRLAFAAGVCGAADPGLATSVAQALALIARVSASNDTSSTEDAAADVSFSPSPSPVLLSMSSHALWSILQLYARAFPVTTGSDGSSKVKSSSMMRGQEQADGCVTALSGYHGGSPHDIARGLHARPAEELVRSAPVLVTTLLTARSAGLADASAVAPEAQLWALLGPSYADGLWQALLPALDYSPTSATGPVSGAPAVSAAVTASAGRAAPGTAADESYRPLSRPRDGVDAALVARLGRGAASPAAASSIPATSVTDGATAGNGRLDAVRHALTARRCALASAAAQQLDLPSARHALLLISEGLASGASVSTTAQATAGPSHSSAAPAVGRKGRAEQHASTVDLTHAACAVASVGRALAVPQTQSPAGASSSGGVSVVAATISELRLAYGRLLTGLSKQISATALARAVPGAVIADRAQHQPHGNGAKAGPDAAASAISGRNALSSSSMGHLTSLWGQLLAVDASLAGLEASSADAAVVSGHTRINRASASAASSTDPLQLSWPQGQRMALRRVLTYCCANIAAELSGRLHVALQPATDEAAVGSGPTGAGTSAGKAGREGISPALAASLASCVRQSQSLRPSSGADGASFDVHDDLRTAAAQAAQAEAGAAGANAAPQGTLAWRLDDAEADDAGARMMHALADLTASLDTLHKQQQRQQQAEAQRASRPLGAGPSARDVHPLAESRIGTAPQRSRSPVPAADLRQGLGAAVGGQADLLLNRALDGQLGRIY